MEIKLGSSPIIIIGMHRSGTSLITQQLIKGGVFMGNNLEHNNESETFIELNDYILKVAHAYWDNPLAIEYFLNDKISFDIMLPYLKEQLNRKTNRIKYLGLKRFLTQTKEPLFGWKDPRTMITLPVWKALFPQMKIIFIYRNGVDVATSLQKRELDVHGGINLKHYSCRCLKLERAFMLWEEYHQLFFKYTKQFNNQNLLSIGYENLLLDFDTNIKRVFDFVGLSASDFLEASESLNKNRAFSFQNNSELKAFYENIKESDTMKKLGYNNFQYEF